jgi:hypothetical protein
MTPVGLAPVGPAATTAPRTERTPRAEPPRAHGVAFEIAKLDLTDACAWVAPAELPPGVQVKSSKYTSTSGMGTGTRSEERSVCVASAVAPLQGETLRSALSAFHPPAPLAVVLQKNFPAQAIVATSSRVVLTDVDVLDAQRVDLPPEVATDLFGHKRPYTRAKLVLSLSPDAAERVRSLLSSAVLPPFPGEHANGSAAVIVDGRVTDCIPAMRLSEPWSLLLMAGQAMHYNTVPGGAAQAEEDHEAEDALAAILARLHRSVHP